MVKSKLTRFCAVNSHPGNQLRSLQLRRQPRSVQANFSLTLVTSANPVSPIHPHPHQLGSSLIQFHQDKSHYVISSSDLLLLRERGDPPGNNDSRHCNQQGGLTRNNVAVSSSGRSGLLHQDAVLQRPLTTQDTGAESSPNAHLLFSSNHPQRLHYI